jgi:hypothetical protein
VIRLAWHQFRLQAAVAFGALAVLAIVLAITGPHLVHLYDTTVATCKAQGDCNVAIPAFDQQDTFLRSGLDLLVLVAPALLGVFWGAPLIAREFETGSFRLAWTQSVTRTRWLAAKFGIVALSTVALTGLLTIMVTWWFSPFDRMHADRFSPSVFGGRDIVPIGHAAFACALGVTAGLLIRRTVPAMAATLVAFVGARLAMTYWIRPHFMAPAHLNMALSRAPGLGIGRDDAGDITVRADAPHIPNAWVVSSRIVDAAGHAPSSQFLRHACPNIGPPRPIAGTGNHIAVGPGGRAAFEQCIAKVSTRFHEAVTYQPAGRYWAFQWYETLVFLGFGGLLAGLCFWWIRRRLT